MVTQHCILAGFNYQFFFLGGEGGGRQCGFVGDECLLGLLVDVLVSCDVEGLKVLTGGLKQILNIKCFYQGLTRTSKWSKCTC